MWWISQKMQFPPFAEDFYPSQQIEKHNADKGKMITAPFLQRSNLDKAKTQCCPID
jgi:hypothetical protein